MAREGSTPTRAISPATALPTSTPRSCPRRLQRVNFTSWTMSRMRPSNDPSRTRRSHGRSSALQRGHPRSSLSLGPIVLPQRQQYTPRSSGDHPLIAMRRASGGVWSPSQTRSICSQADSRAGVLGDVNLEVPAACAGGPGGHRNLGSRSDAESTQASGFSPRPVVRGGHSRGPSDAPPAPASAPGPVAGGRAA